MEFDPIAKIVLDSDRNPVPENFPGFVLNFLPHILNGVRDCGPFPEKFLSVKLKTFRPWFHEMVICTNVFGTPRTTVLLRSSYYISHYRPKSDYWLNSFSLQLLDDSSTMLAK